jgi:translin
MNMVNFEKIRQDLQGYDQLREQLIKKSRDVLKLSKQLIYAVHRSEAENAKKLSKEINEEFETLNDIAKKNPRLNKEGSYKVAIQEYVEAILYLNFILDGKLKEIDVPSNLFILGLADLPGELGRRAVYLAGKGKYKEVIKIKDAVDNIYGELLKLDLRDNEARRKTDAVKYELRKLEDLVLDLKLKEKI